MRFMLSTVGGAAGGLAHPIVVEAQRHAPAQTHCLETVALIALVQIAHPAIRKIVLRL